MKKIIILILMAAMVGCGGDNKESETADIENQPATAAEIGDTTQIMPLALGNSWIYQYSLFDTVIKEFKPISVDTFLVTGDTVVDDETWYFVKTMTPEGGRVINRSDGLWQYRQEVEPFLFLKFPVEKGDEYVTMIGPTQVVNRVNGVGVDISVPAGQFKCYKYSHFVKQHNLVVDFYYQPGVGGVKMELYVHTGMKPVSKHELLEYDLN